MNKIASSLIFILVCCFSLFAQPGNSQTVQSNPDLITEELALLRKAHTDKEKLDVYVELAWLYRKNNVSLAEAYSDSTILFSKKLNDPKLYWLGLNSKAEALRISGNLEKALKYHQTAYTYAQENKLTRKSAHSLNNIGLILKRQRNLKDAKEYISRAREAYKSINDTDGIITTSTNLGNCMVDPKDYDQALVYYNEVIRLALPRNDYTALGNAYTNIANTYYYTNRKKEAKDFYYKGMIYREKAGVPSDIANSYGEYGYMLYEEGKRKEANEFYKKALTISKQTGDIDRTSTIYGYMREMAAANGDYKTAYFLLDTVRKYNDSIVNKTNVSSLNEMSQKFDSEKKQLSIEKLSVENSLKAKENKMQRNILIIVGVAFILSIILGIAVYNQYKKNQKANHIILSQKEALEEKQKEIIDSITYAKHLQEAILPTEKSVKEFFPENFILYKPKDIVAGDFYWLERKDDLIFIAAADCTGHGVPGAMVSVVCSNALHRVVKEFNITDPGNILDKTRELVLETFTRNNKNVKDGMDISLACLNSKTNQLLWSGANNPLWYIKNSSMEEITANKQSIGKTENPQDFTTHKIQLEKGDAFYLFTDGYADQFGGPKGKKLKYKTFKEVLLQNSTQTLELQKQNLEGLFDSWKGKLEQVDDVCIIGIRV